MLTLAEGRRLMTHEPVAIYGCKTRSGKAYGMILRVPLPNRARNTNHSSSSGRLKLGAGGQNYDSCALTIEMTSSFIPQCCR